MGLSPGDGVLDVACGTGNFTRDFARAVGPDGLVVGLDASTTMLDARPCRTPAACEQVAYVRGDAQDLPFRDQSFDAVCCFAALNLFAKPMEALDSITRRADARRPHRDLHALPRPVGAAAHLRVA